MTKNCFLLVFVFAYVSGAFASTCEIQHKQHKLSLKKEVCEFPEGNKTPCAYIQAEYPGKSPRKGAVVFRKGSDFNSFCLSANKIEKVSKKRSRVISSSRSKELKAYLICPAKFSEASIVLISPNKRSSCVLTL